MKIAGIMAITAVLGSAQQAENQENVAPLVAVYIQTGSADPVVASICDRAKSVASGMFAEAGVRIVWRMGEPKENDRIQPILVDLTTNTPSSFHPGALAYAREFEGVHIRIFYDRVQNPLCPHATAMLLAHVLVHEITHLLQGIDRHSQAGVMKAHWSVGDLRAIVYKPLPFSPEDVLLIHRGLILRASR
jgi:hypothetical protein